MSVKKYRIGNVKIVELSEATQETYSDGAIEDELLELFKTNGSIDQFNQKHKNWATTYHLSPERENLLNWYDFKPGSTILEIGAGCGAITGILAQRASKVVALELSKRRATVNAHRHKNKNNIEVIVG